MTEKRILVADDDASPRNALTRYFESLGHIVDTAESYHGVVELFEKHDYALIVCDNGMPLYDGGPIHNGIGLELMDYAKLSERHSETQFVLHTGDDKERTREAAEALGGTYLYKGGGSSNFEVLEKLLKK